MHYALCLLLLLATLPLSARVDTVRADDGSYKQVNTARTAWEESVILAPGGPCVVKNIQIYYAGGIGTDTVFVTGDAAEGSIPPTQYSWPYNTLIGPIAVDVKAAGWKDVDVSASDLHLGGFDRVVIQHRTYSGKPLFGQDASRSGNSFYFDPTTPNANFYNIPGIFYVSAGDYMVRVVVEYSYPAPSKGSALPPPPSLTDVTIDAGIVDATGGVLRSDLATAVDWDGDGYDDLAIGTQFFHNEGDATFKRVTLPISGSGSVWADVDNDGDQDAFAVNGWGNDKLWRNDGGGSFTDITAQSKILNNAPTVTPLWFDMDHDGDVDLFIANGRKEENGQETYYQDRLFRNNGSGVFEDITAASAIAAAEPAPYFDCWAASLCDYNNDGWTDIFVATYRLAPDRLYKNNGNGTFTEVSRTTTVIGLPTADPSTFGHGMGSDWGDWNNDGYVDLAVGNLGHPDWRASVSNPSLLYVNNGPPSWTFSERHSQVGVKFYEMNAGMAWADLDLDGNLDLWHGQIAYEAYGAGATRNARLYMNQGPTENYRLIDRTWELGARIHGAWTAIRFDYDRDGDVDLLCASGTENVRLFRNDMPATGSSLTLRLSTTAAATPRDAYGARVNVYSGTRMFTRQLPGSSVGGRCSQHSRDLFFGLGTSTSVDSCIVVWPNGDRKALANLTLNRTYDVRNDGTTMQAMAHTRVRLVSPSTGSIDHPDAITLQWARASSTATYDVQVSQSNSFASLIEDRSAITTTSLPLTTLPKGATIYWRVRGKEGASQSQWSAPWSFTIGRPAPLAVTTVTPIHRDSAVLTKATFTWTHAQYVGGMTYATLYDVEISTSSNFSGELITRTALTDTTIGPIDLQPTTTYYWRARGANGLATGAWSAVAMFTTYGAPRSRDLLSPLDKATAVNIRPTCTWQKDPWADSYTVELDTMADFSTPFRKNSNGTSLVILPALKYGKLYHWHVQGKNLVGAGAWSPTWTFTTGVSTGVATADEAYDSPCSISSISPSPITTACTIVVHLASADRVRIRILDLQGSMVAEVYQGSLDAGSHAIAWNAAMVASGSYTMDVEHRYGHSTAPLRIVR
ncbi:hypothetical protein BH10BAC6_BH10BAC6_17550 [soil metagenome]